MTVTTMTTGRSELSTNMAMISTQASETSISYYISTTNSTCLVSVKLTIDGSEKHPYAEFNLECSGRSVSSNVTDLCSNGKREYNFLLVINSNICVVLRRFRKR